MDLFKKCYDFTTADDSKKAGIYPYFHMLESKQDIEVIMEGKRRIMIGSNNYLGLTSHPEVVEAGVKAVQKYGSGCSGSRYLNGTTDMHIDLENQLAEFLHKEACCTMSTGFQTNLGIISSIVGRHDITFSDKENHGSIYDGIKLSYGDKNAVRYEHNDMADLEKKLAAADPNKAKFIVTDGVFSMSGDICNLPELVRLKKKYNARILVDDAHGFGVLGKCGRGTAEHFGLEDEVDLIMGTFSKSLASLGGYVVGDEKVVDYIRHTSRPFIFSASITPVSVACTLKALEILKREPERVQRLADIAAYARNGFKKRGISVRGNNITPIIPLFTYELEKTMVACNVLFENGVFANPVVPPATTPQECLVRTSYMSTHTEAILDEAMDIIQKVFKQLEII